MGAYLGNDGLSCAVVFEEEVVSLDEELAGVFLFCRCPLSPQNNRTMGALLLQHTVPLLLKKNEKKPPKLSGLNRRKMEWGRQSSQQ